MNAQKICDDLFNIAPVKSMIGDTMTLQWEYYDWINGNYAGTGSIGIVLD